MTAPPTRYASQREEVDVIISHKHRFVYVKTRKTASTSLEIALSKYCGPDDVITPITPNNQAERTRLGYPGPQNHQLRTPSGRELTVLHHMPVGVAREILGERHRDYFFFTVERNPFDRIISQYYWEVRPEPWPKGAEPFIPNSIEDLLRHGGGELLSNWPLYADGDDLAVDLVGRYENLESDLVAISERIGLPETIELPRLRAKSGFRRDDRHYRDVLSEAERALVETICRRELDAFGYRW